MTEMIHTPTKEVLPLNPKITKPTTVTAIPSRYVVRLSIHLFIKDISGMKATDMKVISIIMTVMIPPDSPMLYVKKYILSEQNIVYPIR